MATLKFPKWENNPCAEYVFGIDGCPNGWVVAAIQATGEINHCELCIIEEFSQIIPTPSPIQSHIGEPVIPAIMVDMPIGLLDYGRRPCDRMTRRHIGARASSVFPAPRRPMLAFKDYEAANAWGKLAI